MDTKLVDIDKLNVKVREQQDELDKAIDAAIAGTKTGIWNDSWGAWPQSLLDYKTTGTWDYSLGVFPVWNGAAWGARPKAVTA
jgi:hypothetical protein